MLLLGCENRTLEKDMDEYCSCMQQYETMDDYKKCLRMMDSIVQEYEFDPEASSYIRQRIKECGISERL